MDKNKSAQKASLAESGTTDSSPINNSNVGAGTAPCPPADPQVKPKRPYAPRRTFSVTYKTRILEEYDACRSAQERGALLRQEGLYLTRIYAWKSQRKAGKFNNTRQGKNGKHDVRVDHLTRENEQLKKKLAQAEAIIDLQKKVSELLGTHILPQEKNEVSS